jgi:hypothetical protein
VAAVQAATLRLGKHPGVLAKVVSRLPFLATVALIAAALGDPLVETISNTGIFGRGYYDNDHASVIPTLVAGSLLAIVMIVRRTLTLLRDAPETGQWPIEMARHISARSPIQDLPYVLALQFIALFGMESAEQLFVGGRLLGGLAWLGGPLWFSLFIHVLIGSMCTVAIARAMRAIVAHCATLVVSALEFKLDAFARENSALFIARDDESARLRIQILHVHQLGERAPPLLISLT